jgi:uncharacterized membrane protein YdjX (TVP38/TMEM64 family)
VNLRRFGGIAYVAAVAVVVIGLTFKLAPLGRGIEDLQQLGPVAFYALFGFLISLGLPPTPFLLAAGVAFDLRTNLVGVILSYGGSLSLSFYVSRLFQPRLERFLTTKTPRIGNVIRENSISAIVLVRLTPGLPYVLQNCLLVSLSGRFVPYFIASLLPSVLLAMLLVVLSTMLLTSEYAFVTINALLFLCIILLVLRKVASSQRQESSV